MLRQWVCLQCHSTFETADKPVANVKCPECRSGKYLRALVAQPSKVRGYATICATDGAQLDLGLALLREAQT